MATSQSERSPYEASGGAGGKFRKKPYRRHQATPYDRPPTALRNAGIIPGDGGNGWLRKIVDPAQRLLAAGAHRLFSSVFKKRLTQPPPPPPPQPPEADQDERGKQQETDLQGTSREQEVAISEVQQPASTSEGGCFTELENILKQKTFNRSEIDRLTALLHARTVDEGRKLEDLPSKSINGKEEVSDMIGQDNGSESQLTKTHVLDEEVASPAELAKAYMGSRPSKVAPSIPGTRTPTIREDSAIFAYSQSALKSPVMSLVPRSSPRLGALENGYMTPRSRGRTAIYSMARTPYSRVLPTPSKSVEPVTDGYRGPSSSQAWEHGRVSGSNALKRRSSIFENDIGSVGPIRRIRQKPNLISQRNWSLPVSGAGVTEVSDHPSSSRKLLSLGEKNNFTDQSVDNEDSDIPVRNMASMSSRSTEMASKILQQLDKIVSPPKERTCDLKLASASEKLPSKLSPSKLRGQALKSLEHIDSSKFLDIVRDGNKLDDSAGRLLHDAREAASQKPDRVEQNGPSNISFSNIHTMNGLDDTVVSKKKDVIGPVKSADSNSTNFLAHPASQQKRAFKMSAHEDFFDLDDDGHANEMPTCTLVEGREKLDTSVVDCKQAAAEAVKVEKSMPISEANAPASALKEKIDVGTNDLLSSSGKSASLSFASVPVASTAVQSNVQATQTTSKFVQTGLERQSNDASPVFGFGDKMASSNEQNALPTAFGLGLNNGSVMEANKVSQFSFASSSSFGGSTPKFGIPSDTKLESSSSLFSVSVGPTVTAKVPEFYKTDGKKDLKDGVVSATPEPTSLGSGATPSTSTAFPFGIPLNSSTSSQSVSSPISAELNATVTQKPSPGLSFTSTTSNGASSTVQTSTSAITASLSMSISAPSLPASTIFKFGSSESTSVSQATSTPSVALGEAKTKVDTDSGNVTSNLFPGPSANATTGSSIFGFSAPASTTTSETKKLGSSLFDAANGSPQLPASTSGTAVPALTQSVAVQSGSSAASFSFGLSGNTGSSLFGSSSAPKLFSGASFGMSSASSSVASSVSTGSSTTSNAFGSWPSLASPVFGTSSASESTGFSFSAPAASSSHVFGSSGSTSASGSTPVFGATSVTTTSNGAPIFGTSGNLSASTGAPIFGSTTSSVSPIFGSTSASPIFGSTGASSASTFSFTSAASSTPSVSVFGNSNPGFSFGSVPSGNNDQMNAEDSMAEDTVVATTPSVPVFGQQPISPQPSSAFMFNSQASTAANPFQFGSQPNLATQPNASPFQASGSLDLGGGSFSLGASGDKSGRKIIKVKHKQRRK